MMILIGAAILMAAGAAACGAVNQVYRACKRYRGYTVIG